MEFLTKDWALTLLVVVGAMTIAGLVMFAIELFLAEEKEEESLESFRARIFGGEEWDQNDWNSAPGEWFDEYP